MNKISIKVLIDKFNECNSALQDCVLKIDTFLESSWYIYFRLGRIVWISGGHHRFRRWHRSLKQFCPNVNLNHFTLSDSIEPNLYEYIIIKLLRENQKLKRKEAVKIINKIITESLFDIFLSGSKISKIELLSMNYNNSPLKEALLYLKIDSTIEQVRNSTNKWIKSGLSEISPDDTLVLIEPHFLQKLTDSQTYKKILFLVDGNRTLRDLELITKQDLLTLARSFLPYIERNIIGFRQIADLPDPIISQNRAGLSQLKSKSDERNIQHRQIEDKRGTILCIDDDRRVCQTMNQILTREGYNFIEVIDSLQILSILIENKPDLIFLDLIMPVFNGYEVCSLIRKISQFKSTPIVILTGNDGIVDRVRAKVVGASEFIAKPIDISKVLTVVDRYLPQTASVRS